MGQAEKLTTWDDLKRRYLASIQARGIPLELGGRHASRWARHPRGWVAIPSARESPRGDRWWLSLNEKEFESRDARGIILLCRAGEDLIDFGIPAERAREFLPHLSKEGRSGERKLNVVRRGERHVLQIPGGREIDLTPARGDLSWLEPASFPPQPTVRKGSQARGAEPPAGAESTFFARVRRGRLEPLDDIGLPEGDLVLVRATPARVVPATGALRRIVARGGPASLPADFAEQHDHYARGAARQ